LHNALIEHKEYIDHHGDDMPAISGWKWGQASRRASAAGVAAGGTSTEGDNV
jgi:xylulose-5-phosphate/fructose-6-phosphate phosphoketolase